MLGVSDKIYDELLIKSLLGEDVNVATIKEHFKKYDKVIDDAVAGGLIYELCLERPLIYGCKICRDRDCGGITIAVKRDPDFYCWFGYNSLTCDDEEIFRFAKLEYEDVFAQYLANWKKARTGKGDHPRVSRFPKW